MAEALRAIETTYQGYRFRSRLEARWAVFFDALDVRYAYEPEGFDLGEAGRYLPDFWLPAQDCWVEIKGRPHFGADARPQAELARRSRKRVFIFDHPEFEAPRFERDTGDFRGAWGRVIYPEYWDDEEGGDFGAHWFMCSDCGGVGVGRGWGDGVRHQGFCCVHRGIEPASYNEHPQLLGAYAAARAARFEHGESGGRPLGRASRRARALARHRLNPLPPWDDLKQRAISEWFGAPEPVRRKMTPRWGAGTTIPRSEAEARAILADLERFTAEAARSAQEGA